MIFGISTSSFQYEENNRNSQFYNHQSKNGVMHKKYWKRDLKLLKDLGIQSYRFSIEWSIIEKKEGIYDEVELQRYETYLKDLKEVNIEPVVCLFHFSQPKWFLQKNGFMDGAQSFCNFASMILNRWKGKVTYIMVYNEPNVYSVCSYLISRWPPRKKNYFHYSQVLKNMEKVYNLLVDTFHTDFRFGFSIAIIPHYYDTLLNSIFDSLWNECFQNHVSKKTFFVGVNYYFSKDTRWSDITKSSKLDFFEDKETSSNLGWPVDAKNIDACFPYIEKYLPHAELWITENGLSSEDADEQCIFLHDHIQRVVQNPKVKRYYWWTLLDCWEWDYARRAKFGLVSVNPKTFRRKKKRSFSCYQSLIQQYKN